MQAAKEAARNFLNRDRHHDTEVCEAFKPAITKETFIPIESVQETVALDREIHRDHHQTRIQPISDHVREDEKHSHDIRPVEYREQKHGKEAEIRRKLDAEAQQFRSTTTTLPATRSTTATSKLQGEHIHHHVHEVVQPIIEREIVQPTVIYTMIPIHERIEAEPTLHPATVQPKMTLDEFQRAGGILDGRAEVCDVFEGEPQVKENGGAEEKHTGARLRADAFRQGGVKQEGTYQGAGAQERFIEGTGMREGMRESLKTPPISAH